jgi:hypothetical protein
MFRCMVLATVLHLFVRQRVHACMHSYGAFHMSRLWFLILLDLKDKKNVTGETDTMSNSAK